MQTVDIIIPVYNEEKTLENILEILENTDFCGLNKNFIIVDDCSTDSTREILKRYEEKYTIVYKEKNGGKGSAVYEGFKAAKGDIVIIQDADLEYNPSDYAPLLKLIKDGEADVAYGSRFLGTPFKDFMFLSYVANKFLTFLTNLLYGTKLTDMETCYKAMKREFVQDMKINSRKFDLEPEITAKLVKKGAKIKELPIKYNARSYEEGKKITYKDGLMAIKALFYYRFFD
ncbi:MAG: glycosyltransferase family 2 protein [Candidatus Gastranaerophilales bacterium]|nr:glycosyltransferase family 2 protein [Candidatus Gastranaerophilales bacterium]